VDVTTITPESVKRRILSRDSISCADAPFYLATYARRVEVFLTLNMALSLACHKRERHADITIKPAMSLQYAGNWCRQSVCNDGAEIGATQRRAILSANCITP
jgi:hypothetical protein